MFKLLLRLWLFQCVMCRCCRQFQISPRNELKWKNDVTRGSIDRADNLCWEEGPCVEIFCGAAPPYRDAAAAAHYSAQNFFLTRLRGSIDTWSATKTLGSKRKDKGIKTKWARKVCFLTVLPSSCWRLNLDLDWSSWQQYQIQACVRVCTCMHACMRSCICVCVCVLVLSSFVKVCVKISYIWKFGKWKVWRLKVWSRSGVFDGWIGDVQAGWAGPGRLDN